MCEERCSYCDALVGKDGRGPRCHTCLLEEKKGTLMSLCNAGHEEICYSGQACPACDAIAERDLTTRQLLIRIDNLKEQIDDMCDTIAILNLAEPTPREPRP